MVSLKLQSGELLNGIPVGNTERSLSQFLDGALKQLEVSRRGCLDKPLHRQADGVVRIDKRIRDGFH